MPSVLILLSVLCFFFILKHKYMMIFMLPKKTTIKKNPKDFGMDYDHFVVRNREKTKIDSWYIRTPAVKSSGTVVFCHNHGGSKEKILPYAKFLNEAGYNTILFDFTNHGRSGKNFRLFGALKRRVFDIECVVEHASSLDSQIKENGLIIMGFSLGCVSGVYFANRCPYAKAIILDSGPPYFVKDIFGRLFKRVLGRKSRHFFLPLLLQFKMITGLFYEKKIRNEIRKISPKPVFFIHGDRDTIIPDIHTKKLFSEYAENPKRYWFVKDCFHLTAHFSRKKEYENQILNFLLENNR